MKIADARNMPLTSMRTRPLQYRNKLSIAAFVTFFCCFGMVSLASGASGAYHVPLQPGEGGHIDLEKVFFIKNSLAASNSSADRPSGPATGTPEEQPTAMDIFMEGIDALDMENFDEAAKRFKEASAMDPQNLEFQYHLGVAYVRIKKNREALEIFESLTRQYPKKYFKAYFDIAAIYSSEKKFERALETLRKAEKIDPKSGRVFLDMGYAYKDSGNYEQAIECFRRAKELDPQTEPDIRLHERRHLP